MTPNDLQVKAYLKKIGFKGTPSVTLACLKKIVEGHAFTFPFETLSLHDSRLDYRPDRRTSLNFNTLFRKLVYSGRGGRCVELNTLLQSMLKAIGFQVTPILSDDLWMSAHLAKEVRPKHSAGIIALNGQLFLIDAAFGGIGIIGPMLLKEGPSQQYSEKFKIKKSEEYTFELQVWRNEEWKSLYGFDIKKAKKKQYKALNKRNANTLNPNSIFKAFFSCTKPFKIMSHIEDVVSKDLQPALSHRQNSNKQKLSKDSSHKTLNNGRYVICGDKFSISECNALIHREKIESQEKLHEILQKYFNMDLRQHYLRYDETAMLAYQKGISRPVLHSYHTRLRERYDQIVRVVKESKQLDKNVKLKP